MRSKYHRLPPPLLSLSFVHVSSQEDVHPTNLTRRTVQIPGIPLPDLPSNSFANLQERRLILFHLSLIHHLTDRRRHFSHQLPSHGWIYFQGWNFEKNPGGRRRRVKNPLRCPRSGNLKKILQIGGLWNQNHAPLPRSRRFFARQHRRNGICPTSSQTRSNNSQLLLECIAAMCPTIAL
jgi:hypothetical protein